MLYRVSCSDQVVVIDLDSTEQEILDHVVAKSREDIVESPAVDENEVFPTHAAMLVVNI